MGRISTYIHPDTFHPVDSLGSALTHVSRALARTDIVKTSTYSQPSRRHVLNGREKHSPGKQTSDHRSHQGDWLTLFSSWDADEQRRRTLRFPILICILMASSKSPGLSTKSHPRAKWHFVVSLWSDGVGYHSSVICEAAGATAEQSGSGSSAEDTNTQIEVLRECVSEANQEMLNVILVMNN